jgi:hypothetical protein
VCPERETSMHNFSCSGGPSAVFIKSAGTRCAELVLLHPVGSVTHIVHSRASRARNVNTLFFKL